MNRALRILIVDDSEEDAVLLERHLINNGYDLATLRVDTPTAFCTALEQEPWDVIISDFVMPSFSGEGALALLKESHLDIPFISVSGTVGEAQAVAIMRAGAHDHVIKENLARLGPSIEREMRAAAVRHNQKQMQEAAAHLAAIVESSHDAIISKSLDGTILTWNHAAETIYGYPAAEIIGRSVSCLIPPDRPDELVEVLDKIAKGVPVARFDTRRLRKDGSLVEVSVTVSPIRNSRGMVIGASSIGRDISERRRQEAERVKLIADLTTALAHTRTLQELLPICASCKKIRDDRGYWQQVEVYLKRHSGMGFTHGLCPDCATRLYPEFAPERDPA